VRKINEAEMIEEPVQATTPPAKALGKKRRAMLTLIFFTALNIVLVVVLWTRLTAAQHIISGAATVPLVGHAAPDFTITPFDSTSGQIVRLSSFKGHPVILNFWASWCPPCNDEMPLLQSTWQQHQTDGVIFLGIDYQDQQPAAEQFLQKYHITYPNGPDTSGSISVDYAVSNVPATIFIDRSGVVVRQHLGQVDAKTLQDEIQQLLK
jgi:cytochrome c biogenesis protein CcmG/thiol:disulfide interchange protein DsbE